MLRHVERIRKDRIVNFRLVGPSIRVNFQIIIKYGIYEEMTDKIVSVNTSKWHQATLKCRKHEIKERKEKRCTKMVMSGMFDEYSII